MILDNAYQVLADWGIVTMLVVFCWFSFDMWVH